MSVQRFEFADKVKHARRPEWGIGTVIRVEAAPDGSEIAQRLSVRFPNAGLKTLNTTHAPLERVEEETPAQSEAEPNGFGPALQDWDQLSDDQWLAPVMQRRVHAAMRCLPPEASDPFTPVRTRLQITLGLYRFERTGHSLIDWAIAQTGVDDPMSRFNRHELEQFFDRWALERATHLLRLVAEFGDHAEALDELLEGAPPAARMAVRRRAPVR